MSICYFIYITRIQSKNKKKKSSIVQISYTEKSIWVVLLTLLQAAEGEGKGPDTDAEGAPPPGRWWARCKARAGVAWFCLSQARATDRSQGGGARQTASRWVSAFLGFVSSWAAITNWYIRLILSYLQHKTGCTNIHVNMYRYIYCSVTKSWVFQGIQGHTPGAAHVHP